ncbi:hypothetical protein FPV67DRAFT_1671375 [Lyophyllum atratum]|nr:hypothetical protein FPV67DRAFT_1671375 [Lyophyllum atratum]
MRFSVVFFLASFAVSGFAASITDVLPGIALLTSLATALNDAIIAFPNTGGTLFQALSLHTATTTLAAAIDTTTAAVPKALTESDARSILDAIEGLTPTIIAILDNITARRDTVMALPFSFPMIGMGAAALVKKDVTSVSASTAALENALLSASPETIRQEGSELKDLIDAAFANTIDMFA